jgi:seryl-tRNA synthetase
MTDEVVQPAEEVIDQPVTTEEPAIAADAETDATETVTDPVIEEAESEAKEHKRSAQARINELTWKNKQLQKQIGAFNAKAESSEGIKRDLAEHEAEKLTDQRNEVDREIWQAREEAAQADIPDYEQVVKTSKAHIEDSVADEVMSSDMAAYLLYHLALPENAGLLEKLNTLDEKQLVREVAKLEILLENKKTADVVMKKTTKAPPPVTAVKTGTSVVEKNLMDLPLDKYTALRRSQGACW